MRIAAATVLLFSISLAGEAFASQTLSLSAAEPAVGECPQLLQIKYPWLGCATNAHGASTIATATVAANASWETDRQIPRGYPAVEGRGHWGPRS